MKKTLMVSISLMLVSPCRLHARSFSEADMVSAVEKSSAPQVLRILAKQQSSQYQKQAFENRRAPQWTQALFYQDSQQDVLPGQMMQKRAVGADFGLQGSSWKGFNWNVGLGLTESSNELQQTPGVVQNFDIKTLTPKVGLDVDLWKNFWGYRDRHMHTLHHVQNDVADLEMQLLKAQLRNQIRQIYWDLAGLELRKQLLDGQIVKTNQQVKLMKERFDHGLAEEDDLAGLDLQRENLKIQKISLDQNRSALLSQIQDLLPEQESLQLTGVQLQNITAVRKSVMMCIGEMMSYQQTPMQLTPYDEWVRKINQQYTQQDLLNDEEGEMDIHLSMSIENTGLSTQHLNDAMTQAGHDKHKTSVQLSMAIPLGEGDVSKKFRKASTKYQWQAAVVEAETRLKGMHEYTLASLQQLLEVIKLTDRNRLHMDKILAGTQKKYEKGRIPLMNLLDQEKQSLSLDVNTIDSKVRVVKVLLRYFALFPEVSCEFNQKVGA